MSRLQQCVPAGWRLAIGCSVFFHAGLLIWILVEISAVTKQPVAKPVSGRPVIAEALDPQATQRELEKLDQLREKKAAALAAEKQRVQQLQAEKKRAEEARKEAERKKAEAERKLAAAKKEQVRIAAEKKAREVEQKRQQQEAAQRQREAERKALLEQQREAERKRAEEQARKMAEEQARLEAAEAERLARERQEKERLRQMQEAMALEMQAEQLQLDQQQIAHFSSEIRAKVTNSWLRPLNWSQTAAVSCDVAVKLVPGGEVIAAQVVGSCGSAALNRSVETAVVKASPLPVPDDQRLFNQHFRSFRFVFHNE